MRIVFSILFSCAYKFLFAQNVGVGTTTPQDYGGSNGRSLEIASAGNGYIYSSSLALSLNTGGSNYGVVGNINFVQSNTTAPDKRVAIIQSSLEQYPVYGSLANPRARLTFFTNNGNGPLNAMSIRSNGFVGIGIPNPPNSLSVSGNADFSGNLGIGNSNPAHKLSVSGNAYITGNMGVGNASPLRPLSFPQTLGEKILLYPGPNGEVGIGVYGNELRLHSDNPGAAVSFGTQDNAGNFTQAGRFQHNGSNALFVNGNIWANGTTYASDARFKKNILPIAAPLERLMQLNGVEYDMDTDQFTQMHFSKGRQIGLLAQNVETVVPEAVNEIDGYKGVDYAKLVPLLIESIRELKDEVEVLKNKLNNQRQNFNSNK